MSTVIEIGTSKEDGSEVKNQATGNKIKLDGYKISVPDTLDEFTQALEGVENVEKALKNIWRTKAIAAGQAVIRLASKEEVETGLAKLLGEAKDAIQNFDGSSLLGRGEGAAAKAKKVDTIEAAVKTDEFKSLSVEERYSRLAALLGLPQ